MQLDLLQLLGMILAISVIIILVMRRFNYGLALIFGSLILGFFFGFSLNDFAQVFLSTLTDPVTCELALVIALIPILAFCMTETGMIEDFLEGLKGFVSSGSVLVMVPAMLGMLPMPGGALFSAPYIDGEAEKMRMGPDLKSFVNVWFRHCMFLVYPMTPTLILASRLSGVDLFRLILIQIPIFVIYLSTGYVFSILSIRSHDKRVRDADFHRIIPLFISVSPLILVILLMALGVPLALALIIGIGLVFGLKRVSYRKVLPLMRRGFNWRLVFAVFGMMLFSHMIQASGAINVIISYIGQAETYPLLFLILFSCFAGVATAQASVALAIVFPMALQMLGNLTPVVVSILYLTIFFSYLVSPMHLCLILTAEYYKARLQGVYRRLIPLSFFVCLTGLILAYGLLRHF